MLQLDQAWIIPDTTDGGFFYSSFSRGVSVIVYSSEELPTIQDSLRLAEQSLLEADVITYDQSQTIVTHLRSELPIETTSFAIVFNQDSYVYLFTHNHAEVQIARNSRHVSVCQGDQDVSGVMQPGDTFILAVGNTAQAQGLRELYESKLQDGGGLKESANALYEEGSLDAFPKAAIVAIGVSGTIEQSFVSEVEPLPPSDDDVIQTNESEVQASVSRVGRMSRFAGGPRKKLFILLALLLICLVGWSALFGSQRRAQKEFESQVAKTRESITKIVADAEDVGAVDPAQGLQDLAHIDAKISELQKLANTEHIKDTSALVSLQKYVEKARRGISKEEQTHPEEYYDLALISKEARGNALYLKGDALIITDSQATKAYNLSLSEKSVKEISLKSISSVKKIVVSGETMYALTTDGVWRLGDKNEKVISNDGWGTIEDIDIFNGNIYLLDSKNQMIWKYLVAEEGFSSAQPYLTEQFPRLSSAKSMGIDGAIYVAAETVLKFIQGHQDTLTVESPTSVTFDDLSVSQDQDTMAVLDNQKSKLFLFSKSGGYKKQILANELKNAKDLVTTDEGKTIVLSNNALYLFE